MKNKTITVSVSASTWRWLRALARANSKTEMNPGTVSAEDLLAQAAFCMADAAGKRTGSWEADVAERLLSSSGFQAGVEWPELERLMRLDAADNAAHFRRWDSMSPAQKADDYGYTGTRRDEFIAGCRQSAKAATEKAKQAYAVRGIALDESDPAAAAWVADLTTPDGPSAVELLPADATGEDRDARLLALTAKVEDTLASFDFYTVAAAMRAVKWTWHGRAYSPSVPELRQAARDLLLNAIGVDGGITSGGFSAERTPDGFFLSFQLSTAHA